MYKILHSLEEPTREVMYLRLNGNFSFKEIGEIMGTEDDPCRWVIEFKNKTVVIENGELIK